MEILTYVLEGVLEHQDSLGHVEQLKAGELQRMTAGSGIQHSEYNPSSTEMAICTNSGSNRDKLDLRRSTNSVVLTLRLGRAYSSLWPPATAATVRWSFIRIRMSTSAARPLIVRDLRHSLDGHDAWLQVVRGSLKAGPDELDAGDGVATNEPLDLQSVEDAEVILFEFTEK